MLDVRRRTLGYVSQFLRALPRTSCLDVVCAPLVARGTDPVRARRRAAAMLERLHIDRTLWPLAPATFSGGEQQRINVARGLICDHPLLLLDEPTASLDADNASIVAELVEEACARGAAVLGIFHDLVGRSRNVACDPLPWR